MLIYRLNNNFDKVNTKDELTKLLEQYRGILTEPIMDYLNSLIELEFSVIREYIEENDKMKLSELEIYKRIAIYNIYNRALNLFKKSEPSLDITGNESGYEELCASIKLGNKNIRLFSFDYSNRLSIDTKIPKGYKTMKIGTISLYQTLESQELREAELNRVMQKLERLYDAHNPYFSRPGVFGGPASQWAFAHNEKITYYEKKFTELDSKKELSDDDKKEIEMTNKIHSLLLEDYGLSNESFEEEENKQVFNRKESNLQKILVKKQPNLTIENNIKYI